MTSVPVCNLNCVCVNGDCAFSHFLNSKERRVVKKLYDGLQRPSKVEENSEKRKANCRYGQLCYVKDCGFRHRLSFADRLKLVDEFNKFKLSDIRVEKKVKEVRAEGFKISAKNHFDLLEDVEEVDEVVEKETVREVQPVVVKPFEFGKKWADLFDGNDEEDFYMKF
jgi:hypothetical protein